LTSTVGVEATGGSTHDPKLINLKGRKKLAEEVCCRWTEHARLIEGQQKSHSPQTKRVRNVG